MEIKAKFYKLKRIKDFPFYCECVSTSINVIRKEIIEHIAKLFAYKLDDTDYSYFSDSFCERIEKIKNMNDEEIINEAFNMNLVGINAVLPTIPKIILENVDDFIDTVGEDNYVDITDTVVNSIKDGIDLEGIKEFISTHNDDEIVDEYCANDKFKDMFWDL